MSNPYDTATEKMSVLPRTLKFVGELSADEDLLIQGTIEGTIQHTQRVTIGEEGSVKANINAQIIKVEGTVEGDLHAEKSVYVEQCGNLNGNIHAPSVCLVEGSQFNGSITMGQRAQSNSKRGAGLEKNANRG